MVKTAYLGILIVLAALALTGCSDLMPAAEPTPAFPGGGFGYNSAYLNTSYEGALPVTNQLMLGTLELEGTENAVTPAQAQTLLPLWQTLQGTALRDNEERSAVLVAVEKAMTPVQMEAIAAMQLTFADMQTWAESQGISLGFPSGTPGQGPSNDARATAQAQFGNMTEAEREAMRATAQAGGGFPGGQGSGRAPGGQGGGASGGQGAGGRAFAGRGGSLGPMLDPLIELLTRRAAE